MLFKETPIGHIQVPEWEERPLREMDDEQLLEQAVKEHKNFCISPATFAMIEHRFLLMELKHRINPQVGLSHFTMKLLATKKYKDGE